MSTLNGISSSSSQYQTSPMDQNKSSSKSAPPEIKQALISSGMKENDADKLLAQGKEAVMKYAQEHNITLPQPPAQAQGSIMQNNSSTLATTGAGVAGNLDLTA